MKGAMRDKRIHFLLALLCALLPLALPGCAKRVRNSDGASAPPARPERIISLSPNVTEILYGVGAFDRVVAVTDYCDYPPEVTALPRIGGWQNTNIERVASFRPDLVILTEWQAPFMKDRLDALGLQSLSVPSRTLEDTYTAIEQIGRATGHTEQAQRLAAETRAAVEEVRARTRDLPRRRVLCVVDRVPGTLRDLYAAGQGSYFAQLIEAAGGAIIGPSVAETGVGRISKEAVITLNPEIIIDMVQGAEGALAEDPQAVWRELPQVQAVRAGRVHPVRETYVLHASQFVGQTARRFAAIIHPEVFASERPAQP